MLGKMIIEKEIITRKMKYHRNMIIEIITVNTELILVMILIDIEERIIIIVNIIPKIIVGIVVSTVAIVIIIPKIIVGIGTHGMNGTHIIEIIETNIVMEDTIKIHREVYILHLIQVKEVLHFQLEDKN